MSVLTPDLLRVALLGVIVNIHAYWTRLVNLIVPDPYLDEVFHIPQAQAYWAGNWTTWDPKITTPPGLYVFSSLIHGVWKPLTRSIAQTTTDLRSINFWLLYLLLVAAYVLNGLLRRQTDGESVMQKEFNIVLFPLFFFFSGLYYTDLFSAFTVVVTYVCWLVGARSTEGRIKWQLMHFLSGLVALGTRQTNIFWVAVFLGGLQVIETAEKIRGKYRVFDPPIIGAYFEDFVTMCISVGFTAINDIPALLLDLWPQLSLLTSFATFVFWNGSVVLGDKQNHAASLHLPQMLYLWPFIIFFSWPILLPHFFNPKTLQAKLPRLSLAIIAMLLMTTAVYLNTIVHPFILADNRHYVFYVFRILFRHPLVKYAVVPIYFISAWLAIQAMGGPKAIPDEFAPIPAGSVRVSFVLVWLISTTLSLVTAPLVEPRYSIVPWLIWRLHVSGGSGLETNAAKPAKENKGKVPAKPPNAALALIAAHILWLESAWFLLVNYGTCWMFLYRGFEWAHEPGKVQRFMW